MLTRLSRITYFPPQPGIPGWAGGTVCSLVPVEVHCGQLVQCLTFPLPPGNIPPYGEICVSTSSCFGQDPHAGTTTLRCEYIPPRPEVPAVPERYEEVGNNSWNAGANSVLSFDVDCEVAFDMPRVVGVVVGFVADREDPTNPDRVLYGMQFGISGSGESVSHIVESGQKRTQETPYDPADVFKVRRVGQTVSYLKNDAIVYVSSRPCVETDIIVGSSLFSFGDSIP